LTLLGIVAIDYLFWLYIRARRADRAAAQREERFVGRNGETYCAASHRAGDGLRLTRRGELAWAAWLIPPAGRRLLFRHSPVVRTAVPGRLHGGGRRGDREPALAAERSRDLEGPDVCMKEPAPPREGAIRADHDHVGRMS